MTVSRKKFKGWVLGGRRAGFIGNLVGLRQLAHIITKPSKRKQKFIERIVYTGCVHGGSDSFYSRLEKLSLNPPDYLIFTGDITGSPEIEKLKKHFYDGKTENPNGEFRNFEYFGFWAATFSKEKRFELLSTLKPHAEKLLKIVKKIKKLGTKIYLIEGNWDNSDISGVKVIAGKDIKVVFNTKEFFERNGFHFIDRISTLKTKTTLHIFLPYITLLRFDETKKKNIEDVQSEVQKVRKERKTIIMVGHAEANWRVHHLQKNSRALGERGVVIHNFGRAMALFFPDDIIYPHQHARIRDEAGNLINLNSKYVLHVNHEGVRLVDDPKLINAVNKNILVTYIPLGYLEEEDYRL